MDIELARTFLEIARGGSFVAAAQRLHVTQTTVTARVHNLETQLGCRLFQRSRAGARLTDDGERFLGYANQLVQTWDAARRDLPLPAGYREVLNIGGELSLSNPLMLAWTVRLRQRMPALALHAEIGSGERLQKQLELGVLDAALVYRPDYWPGMQVEQLLEEKLILVRSTQQPEPYIYIDWGEEFRRQHDAALPDRAHAATSFSLGPLALQHLLQCGGSGYFRTRVVHSYLKAGVLERVPLAPEFIYPTYLVYSREKDSPALQNALAILRELVAGDIDWSQRWDYEA
ncbi:MULTISPECIES: LysR family transcriptional regulator [unclassified Pseudomonas]|uniref:LysR family transcriptional regulator n=1 Tax=unclassified Pseudomonas TaxID=196821 RepID=UPI0002A2F332|nr:MULTISPECIES: LysR family transcriptional regulator [unclassified Pseudomonas]MBB1607922.1 LysR family transcriptional regulator [Pseudomonas sp. UMC76]MBB1638798.1 LysR family transcriptional regulator [Pseudomonas sp. UME83]NTX87543.1 LysR family transcriptional regulator [Pseudomonas sp. UMA643]NTY18123.1 LysR family transcriptional regulator [Pseudomonas sp. UMC3103]NTY24555.1 LysR family transcriptional regulator [Pseudomonas sp. UMA603]